MDSFISWIGGKKALRKRIIEQFPPEYNRYIEAFGGAGWMLFAEERKVGLEVYNDIDGNLVNLFKCVKYHPDVLQKELEWTFTSRELFFDAKQDIRGLTDIQRAAKFYILIKGSFGTDLHSFGARKRDMEKAVRYLGDVSYRLRNVVVEHMDFERLLRVYDRPDALFYLDPPYFNAEEYYNVEFGSKDHMRLRDALGRIRGKFILSYNDCLEAREMYEGFSIIEANRHDNLAGGANRRRYHELIIKNY